MIIMSIDLGQARTGLAVCDKNEILASPLCVIKEKNEEILADKIIGKISETKAEMIVLGLPKNMDGTMGESALRVKNFAKILKNKINLPVEFWDERRTTVTAHEYLNQTNVCGTKRKSIIDAVSATIILEAYINYKQNSQKN